MGLPARKLDGEAVHGRNARHLRLVKSSTGPRKRTACSRESAARQNFVTFAVLVSFVAVLGAGRVWMSVEAAQASVEAARLRQEIKVERYVGDMLEVQQSALGSPSRIRAIAGATMDMGRSSEVTYIELEAQRRSVASSRSSSAGSAGLDRVIADVLGLAAGEAQVLLVGDVGLASAR